ncbi:MAG TPA: carboxypeptidase regulatory-like domain-containing protein [Gemmatimonadales bacterium]|nr:carboxypeptidase regulatory-like domain-containing protein [Gemmatimonadales bacterium]
MSRSAAQVGSSTDIITGRVTGPDSQPLAGAVVEAVSVETEVTRQAATNAQGGYTILFPDGGGRYRVTARFIGMSPAERQLRRQGDEDRLVLNLQLGVLAVSLEAVTVSARRAGGPGTASGGSIAQSVSSEQLMRLPIDAADLNTVAALAPGVLPLAATDSTTTAFSVAGQRPTANNVTLDGMSFRQGEVPQDALRSTRVITSTYDVARGQFAGGLVTATTRSGTNVPQGWFTSMLRNRSLAWGPAITSPFGAGMTQDQLGGALGGPIVQNRLFVFGALQRRWRGQALPSLATADPGALVRLGVSPDSAARFRALAIAAGAPPTPVDLLADRTTDDVTGLLRVDWRVSDAHTLTLRFEGRTESQEPTRVSPLALPTTGGTRSERSGGVFAALTSLVGGRFINEIRGYAATSTKDVSPFFALPVARVDVTSPLPDLGQGIATLAFGGNAALPQHLRTHSVEISDEASWLVGDGAHRPKLGVYVNATRGEEFEIPNQYGTFVFPSLAAFAVDSPESFTRIRAPLTQAGTAWNEAVYLGDSWHMPGGVRLTYGARLESSWFRGAPAYNRTVDSLFGGRTDRIPSDWRLLPRVGLTWGFGGGPDLAPTTYLRGGVGEFRSPPPTFLYSAALGAPGTPDAQTELNCIGSAVPTPDWVRYAQDPSTIPSHCAPTPGGTMPVTSFPTVVVFDSTFSAPRAWRSSLGFLHRLGQGLWVSVEGNYARGLNQYGLRDLNLIRQAAFSLPEETNRPVEVPADSIIPTTGTVSSSGTRIHPDFGKVYAIRSDLQSVTKQVTLSVANSTRGGGMLRLSYTWTQARDQSSWACCVPSQGFAAPTTAYDPNALEWARSDFERRHAFLGVLTYPLSGAIELGAIARLISGIPFTPLVGSDINGDGARNDRAFVFDPRSTTDTAVVRGMRDLLASAPSAVRTCLERQLGQIATRNSCTGPWQPALDLQLNWRPAWFGSERRLALSILTVNLLNGVDAWLHGANHLQGWGYSTAPDPVLLYVRGFDPTGPRGPRFLYAVNGRFGAAATTGNGILVPFQIGFQGRFTLGPRRAHIPRSERSPIPALRSIVGERAGKHPDAAAPLPPLPDSVTSRPASPANPIAWILGRRDSLGLTADQIAALQPIADSLDAQVHNGVDSLRATATDVRRALGRARDLLRPEQWSKLMQLLPELDAGERSPTPQH